MIKAIFLGKHPKDNGHCLGVNALSHLMENANIEVVKGVSSSKDLLHDFCHKNHIHDNIDNIYKTYESIDLVISYGFMKLIKEPLISSPRIGCINFHPAPLPEWRGMGGTYNYAIYESVKRWGVSSHFVDKNFDSGDIINVNHFNINPDDETPYSLSKKSHYKLLQLFYEVIDIIVKNENSLDCIPRNKQGVGRYISKSDFNKLRKIDHQDSTDIINKKIKAFWCPPHHGATLIINGTEYTLLNDELLAEIAINYNK